MVNVCALVNIRPKVLVYDKMIVTSIQFPSSFLFIYLFIYCFVYNNVFYSQASKMGRAEALVREMEEQGIDAPIEIYHTMMDGYTMVGNEEKCLIVFERLKV